MLLTLLFLVLGILLTVIGIIYIYKIKNRRVTPKEKWNLDSTVKGTVVFVEQRVQHHYNDRDTYSYKPTIKYFANGKEYVSKEQVSLFNSGEWQYAKPDDMVDVWYDSHNPERFWAVPTDEIVERTDKFDDAIYKYVIPFFIFAGAVMMFGCTAFGPDKFFSMLPG